MNLSHHKLDGRRVILALSGGVDSAVAALLLKQHGADVHALHMTNWEDDDGYCTAAADLQDARHLCEQLDIPLHHVNFAREYRERVFHYFLEEYRLGRTPNPDVLCNREIKFGVFLEYAHRLGGSLIATGHYARVRETNGETHLLKAHDKNKDQSYFLHAVTSQALAETVFPLGELDKPEVRRIAREHGLATHDKKDSTGICFIGERPFREFLASFLPANPGPIKSLAGQTVGEHAGLMYYTLGQRQGLGIGGLRDAGDAPWYVVDKELETNTLLVVQGEHPRMFSARIDVGEISWIGARADIGGDDGLVAKAKVRYRQDDQRCCIRQTTNDRVRVDFDAEQRSIAPGQYAVFYDEDRCLGGGVIEQVLHEKPMLRDAV
ncbi:MAG: tRNA 2-thiouridine(34) synthase MnmA [Gammaproteobacteria bacterium]|nr:tRNA 2-thiouridine(34) synthase MnmA [Gammaproteobacteria bacterium]